ncbi:SGNH/GDSL hydrolase family protein, partial [Candidatus Sumerlaeota bacterium]|nr:SGNH/GDSL hydrolase family protein [Candidatus Sumerlaeota bacterium]
VDYLRCYFVARNPRAEIINAGKSGDTTPKAIKRLKSDVLDAQPDLTFVMFGINDCSSWFNVSLRNYQTLLKKIISTLLENNSAVIVMTQNEILDNPYNGKVTFKDYEKYENTAGKVAHQLGVPFIDNFSRWQKLKKEKPETFASYMNDWIHPNHEGHIFYYLTIRSALDKILPPPVSNSPQEQKQKNITTPSSRFIIKNYISLTLLYRLYPFSRRVPFKFARLNLDYSL